MFDNLLKELKRLEQQTSVLVPIEDDAEGYLDRECPAENCMFSFKVRSEDWETISENDSVFCPSCGHNAQSKSWYTQAQIEAAKQYAIGMITNDINKAIRADADASKSTAKNNSFISITLRVKAEQYAILVPVAAAEPMRLRTACEDCGCRYSYVGAAYFCPACGSNSARHTFAQTMNTIRTAAGIEDVLRDILDADSATTMIRALLEKAIQDSVMSFQRLNEQLYEQRVGKKFRRNAFQNLDTGSALWEVETGKGFAAFLNAGKLEKLRIYFQQRHLLAHQQGIVDQDYIQKSNDTTYAVGQRLLISRNSVIEFADIIEELGSALIDDR